MLSLFPTLPFLDHHDETTFKDPDFSPILLIQLTDCHLCSDTRMLSGVDTEASLRAVLQHIQRDHGQAHLVLATGDLAHDGSAHAYERFTQIMATLNLPIRCLPGNHDAPTRMQTMLKPWSQTVTDIGAWRLILLDSSVTGSSAGHLNRDQLELLEDALTQCQGRTALIALHHNPIPMVPDGHDPVMLDNAAELFRQLSRHSHARALLWGHVHDELDYRRGSIRILTTPSTCYQSGRRTGKSWQDLTQPPGYRWLKLYPDSSIATGVRRLEPTRWQAMVQEWAEQ